MIITNNTEIRGGTFYYDIPRRDIHISLNLCADATLSDF